MDRHHFGSLESTRHLRKVRGKKDWKGHNHPIVEDLSRDSEYGRRWAEAWGRIGDFQKDFRENESRFETLKHSHFRLNFCR